MLSKYKPKILFVFTYVMVLCRSQHVHFYLKYFNNSFLQTIYLEKVMFVYDILNELLLLEIYNS